MVRFAVILLVDPQGRVLLQERDEHAPRAANQWGMVGGHVEEGEDADTAAHRELFEETGLRMAEADLRRWWSGDFWFSDADEPAAMTVYAGPTEATDDDIVLGEGRRIVFVDPADLPGLDQAETTAALVPRFLESAAYRELADR